MHNNRGVPSVTYFCLVLLISVSPGCVSSVLMLHRWKRIHLEVTLLPASLVLPNLTSLVYFQPFPIGDWKNKFLWTLKASFFLSQKQQTMRDDKISAFIHEPVLLFIHCFCQSVIKCSNQLTFCSASRLLCIWRCTACRFKRRWLFRNYFWLTESLESLKGLQFSKSKESGPLEITKRYQFLLEERESPPKAVICGRKWDAEIPEKLLDRWTVAVVAPAHSVRHDTRPAASQAEQLGQHLQTIKVFSLFLSNNLRLNLWLKFQKENSFCHLETKPRETDWLEFPAAEVVLPAVPLDQQPWQKRPTHIRRKTSIWWKTCEVLDATFIVPTSKPPKSPKSSSSSWRKKSCCKE